MCCLTYIDAVFCRSSVNTHIIEESGFSYHGNQLSDQIPFEGLCSSSPTRYLFSGSLPSMRGLNIVLQNETYLDRGPDTLRHARTAGIDCASQDLPIDLLIVTSCVSRKAYDISSERHTYHRRSCLPRYPELSSTSGQSSPTRTGTCHLWRSPRPRCIQNHHSR